MDVIYKVIDEDGSVIYLGGHDFGYDDTSLKALDILYRQMNNLDVSDEEENFISSNLEMVSALKYGNDCDFIIDNYQRNVVICGGFEFIRYHDKNISIDYKIDFLRTELLQKEVLSFEEYHVLSSFIKQVIKYDNILVNEKYLLKLSHKKEQ